jgi:hypothetical protein
MKLDVLMSESANIEVFREVVSQKIYQDYWSFGLF